MPEGRRMRRRENLGEAARVRSNTLKLLLRDLITRPSRYENGIIRRAHPRGHIFLIFKYRRMSGNDISVSSPRAAAAAAMVTAMMYPSVRIVCLLPSADPCQRCRSGRAQRRRSIMMTSTMITITTMVPTPINMGFLSGCAPASPDGAAGIWLGALGLLAGCPGPRWGMRSGAASATS